MKTRFPTRTADYTCPFPCGSAVYDVHDERHVGRLDAILSGTAIIRFLDCVPKLRLEIPVSRVRLAAEQMV